VLGAFDLGRYSSSLRIQDRLQIGFAFRGV